MKNLIFLLVTCILIGCSENPVNPVVEAGGDKLAVSKAITFSFRINGQSFIIENAKAMLSYYPVISSFVFDFPDPSGCGESVPLNESAFVTISFSSTIEFRFNNGVTYYSTHADLSYSYELSGFIFSINEESIPINETIIVTIN